MFFEEIAKAVDHRSERREVFQSGAHGRSRYCSMSISTINGCLRRWTLAAYVLDLIPGSI